MTLTGPTYAARPAERPSRDATPSARDSYAPGQRRRPGAGDLFSAVLAEARRRSIA